MKFAFAAAALSAVALAAPAADLAKRDDIDATVLNYALTLEHLEAQFYKDGFAKFSSQELADAGFSGANLKNLKQVGQQEQTHVAFLTAALKAAGATPVSACKYNFGLSSAKGFVALAAIIENVGVSAYAGAAQYITNRQYLTDAAAILAVEAEHTGFLRSYQNLSPIAQPFSDALSFNQVYSLVNQFITSCPKSNPTLPVKAYPKITVKNQGTVYRGNQMRFTVPSSVNTQNTLYCAWPLVGGNIFSQAFQDGNAQNLRCVIPKGEYGPAGQSYFVLTNSQGTITDSNTVAGVGLANVFAPYLAN